MSKNSDRLPLSFYTQKSLEVEFSRLDLSSNGGLLLVRQAEESLQICQGLAACLTDRREPGKVKHPLNQLINQRVYQIVAGYEDSNDSNYLRHDPIFKMICDRVPIVGEELLGSQPTMSRLENQITQKEINWLRRFFLDKFLESYEEAPEEIIMDIDGWDAQTHGHQQLSFFHGYYGHHMYFPVLINEATKGYPLVL